MFATTVAALNSVLMLHADSPLPLVTLARTAGLAYAPAQHALATLDKKGLVTRALRGDHEEFAANPASPYYEVAYLTALIDLPLARVLSGRTLYAAFAYGSLSRPAGGTRSSDLDLLIVSRVRNEEDRSEAASAVIGELSARLHRPVDPWILDPRKVERLRAAGDPHIEAALAGVRLFGEV